MKVQLRSVLKSNFSKLKPFQQNSIIHQSGNNLHILQLNKTSGDFIHLNKENNKLINFTVSPNLKNIFTAEICNNSIHINSYTLQSERKTVNLSQNSTYVTFDLIENVQLYADQFQSGVVFVITKLKNQAVVTLVEIGKMKVIAQGFVNEFVHAKVCSEEGYEISILSKNSLKRLKANDGGWVVEERMAKKIGNMDFIKHEWISLGRCLFSTRTHIHIVQQNNINQTLQITNEEDPITQILKISKGFLTITQNCVITLYIEDEQESVFNKVQRNNINIGKAKVSSVQMNIISDEVFIACNNGKYFYSKLEISQLSKGESFIFQQINLNYTGQYSGGVCTTAGQNYCAISGQKSVQLWDLNRLCPTITLQSSNFSDEKVVKTCAIHPDGHSICIGYSDRVRFYRILLNKFKLYGDFPIKNTSHAQYSHGGQFVAFIFGKGSNSSFCIVNTMSFKQVFTYRLGFKPNQIIWNENDDEIYISGDESNIISVYQISTKAKKYMLNFDDKIAYIRFDYLSYKLLVSCGPQIHAIDSEQNVTIFKPKINNFHYVFPMEGIYIATDTVGGLHYSASIDFEKSSFLPMFVNQKFNLAYRKGLLIAYTSPSNVMLLRAKSSNQNNQTEINENVILVQKEEINKFFDKVKILEGHLDQLQITTSAKLDEQKKKYNQSLGQNQMIFKQQIEFLHKKLAQLQTQKNRQEKGNAKVFDELETGQIKSVNELQKVYDLKIKLHKQKYLTLEQQSMQQKIRYEKIIKSLEQKYHKDIQKVRTQYSQKLNSEFKSIKNQKERHIDFKKKVQTKIIDLEEQSEMTLLQVQLVKDTKIENLKQKYIKLERQFDAKMIALHNVEEDFRQIKQKYKVSLTQIKQSQNTVQQNLNKIKMLERENEKKNKIIQEKNTTIEQQTHQIDALEKAKYVLSFRTTEVRKQLQPKQSLIEKLKSELFKLDEEYKDQVKKNFEFSQKMQKIDKVNTISKKQINDLKISLKNKQRIHNDMCSEIFLIVNNTDPKEWNKSLVKVYQNFIQTDKFKPKTHKNEESTCDQINRHLIHVEQSLLQVATGNDKMLKGKQKQMLRKMKENAELVYDLNQVRKLNKQHEKTIQNNKTEIARLRRELLQFSNPPKSTRANTANTGTTRRLYSKDPVNNQNNNNNSDWFDLSVRRQSDYLLPDKNKKSRIFSAHKTMLWRGEDTRREKSRISDLARELESSKNTIMRQDRMIQELNQRLLGLPEDTFN